MGLEARPATDGAAGRIIGESVGGVPSTSEREPVRSPAVSTGEPTTPAGNASEGAAPNFVLRRLMAGAAALVLLVGAIAIVWIGRGDDGPESVAPTSTVAPRSSSTVAATTSTTITSTAATPAESTTTVATTTTSTTSTTTTTTTTTVAPSTTVLEAGVPVWPAYEILPALDGIAALTGAEASPELAARPVIAVKIDNYRRGRPQWGLDLADVIIEENVEGVTRFVAMFQTRLPDRAGPVRSARTGDLDLFSALNRPILAWSGGNAGVTRWVQSAASSGVLVDFSAQKNGCYNRASNRSAPHNLQLDPSCVLDTVIDAGPARSLWSFDGGWAPPDYFRVTPDSSFEVPMDGVRVGWVWDAEAGLYRRSQDGSAHRSVSGEQVSMNNVVELYVFHAQSPVDARSPNPITVGRGRAVVHRDGVAVEGIWARRTAFDPFTFADAESGEHIPLDPGTTFVELVRDR